MDSKEDISESWLPGTISIYTPASEQMLLHEKANCAAVQAFLKMCELDFTTEERGNAEYMSPTGGVPFIRNEDEIISEFEYIVEFISRKKISLSSHLEKQSDIECYMHLFQSCLTNAELYFTWCHDKTTQEYTYPKFSSGYPWPLNTILYYKKKWETTKKLKVAGITDIDKALKSVEELFAKLSQEVVKPYFFGDKPTELDALIFGHISTILNTALPDDTLAILVRENEPLVSLCNAIAAQYYPSMLTPVDGQ